MLRRCWRACFGSSTRCVSRFATCVSPTCTGRSVRARPTRTTLAPSRAVRPSLRPARAVRARATATGRSTPTVARACCNWITSHTEPELEAVRLPGRVLRPARLPIVLDDGAVCHRHSVHICCAEDLPPCRRVDDVPHDARAVDLHTGVIRVLQVTPRRAILLPARDCERLLRLDPASAGDEVLRHVARRAGR